MLRTQGNTPNCLIVVVTEGGIVAAEMKLPKGGEVMRASIREYAGTGGFAHSR